MTFLTEMELTAFAFFCIAAVRFLCQFSLGLEKINQAVDLSVEAFRRFRTLCKRVIAGFRGAFEELTNECVTESEKEPVCHSVKLLIDLGSGAKDPIFLNVQVWIKQGSAGSGVEGSESPATRAMIGEGSVGSGDEGPGNRSARVMIGEGSVGSGDEGPGSPSVGAMIGEGSVGSGDEGSGVLNVRIMIGFTYSDLIGGEVN